MYFFVRLLKQSLGPKMNHKEAEEVPLSTDTVIPPPESADLPGRSQCFSMSPWKRPLEWAGGSPRGFCKYTDQRAGQ